MGFFDTGTSFYKPAFFWIELNTSLEFQEIFGTEYEHTFFHEYLHFLQDITTTYGYVNSSKALNIIKAMHYKIKERIEVGNLELEIPLSFYDDVYRDTNNNLFENYLKYEKSRDVDEFEINDVILTNVNVEGLNVETYKICFNDDDSIYLGAHAIHESICHILEKNLYGISTGKIKLPYDLAEQVALYYSNIFHNHIDYVLDLCEYSLMFYNSGEIFIKILESLKNDKGYYPIDNDNFYQYMSSIVQPSNGCNVESFFTKTKCELIRDINGVFVSDLYKKFKPWLITTIEVGHDYKKSNKLLFSQIAKKNPIAFLNEAIPKFGMPPVYNQEGQFYIAEVNSNDHNSAYLARSVSEVFDTIVNGSKKCKLKDSCIFANSIQQNKMNITDYCDISPWKNFSSDPNSELCPYCQAWKTFGLSQMIIL